jgi:hypothetical protein
MLDGTMIFTAEECSKEGFFDEKRRMDSINEGIARTFTQGESRPVLRQLTLSEEARKKLKNIFFDDNGSLRESVKGDVDMSQKNGYIKFRNPECNVERNDKRWQIPIGQHKHGTFDPNV